MFVKLLNIPNTMLRRRGVRFLGILIIYCVLPFKSFAVDDIVEVSLGIVSFDKHTSVLETVVEFQIKQGWHIYYKRAGDVGLPTSFNLVGNIKGFNVRWPEPLRHQDVIMDQAFTSYIYEDKVTFPISITLLPQEISVDLAVEVEYAVCNEICTPQKQTLRYQGDLNSLTFDANNQVKNHKSDQLSLRSH